MFRSRVWGSEWGLFDRSTYLTLVETGGTQAFVLGYLSRQLLASRLEQHKNKKNCKIQQHTSHFHVQTVRLLNAEPYFPKSQTATTAPILQPYSRK